MNKILSEFHFIEISSHINNDALKIIENIGLENKEYIQFSYLFEPNNNDIKIMNSFFKNHPEIYFRRIKTPWLKYLTNVEKFRLDFTGENIKLIKNYNIKGLYFENKLDKKRDLAIIEQFKDTLEELAFEGEPKNVEKTISQLKKLKRLYLISVRITNFNFLEGIGIEDFWNYGSKVKDWSYLSEIKTIKKLGIKTNRTLENIDFIKGLNNLEKLELTYLSKLSNFPNIDHLKKLKSIVISQCNKLENIDEIKNK
ncbi:MAG: hypothetical protein LBQ52_09400 [Helicobacteraceae bacterium]|jgi:hypothetical protein|nr:hypothetical protein [Helicobacteraceae bacterium]